MYIEEEIEKDLEDSSDIYDNDYVDDQVDNGELSPEEAAFMRGYNEEAEA